MHMSARVLCRACLARLVVPFDFSLCVLQNGLCFVLQSVVQASSCDASCTFTDSPFSVHYNDVLKAKLQSFNAMRYTERYEIGLLYCEDLHLV